MDNQEVVREYKKFQRMMSNGESASRPRMRKQKELDHLMAQLYRLKHEKRQFLNDINFFTQLHLDAQHENKILRALVAELTNAVNFLIGIKNEEFISSTTTQSFDRAPHFEHLNNQMLIDGCFGDLSTSLSIIDQPTMPWSSDTINLHMGQKTIFHPKLNKVTNFQVPFGILKNSCCAFFSLKL